MKKLLLFTLPTFLFSCIWIDGTTIDGNYKNQSGYVSMLKQTIEQESPQTKLKYILKKKASKTDETKEDDAVISMLKGEYETSIKMLLELNQHSPKKYHCF